jgi:hypothetical protein
MIMLEPLVGGLDWGVGGEAATRLSSYVGEVPPRIGSQLMLHAFTSGSQAVVRSVRLRSNFTIWMLDGTDCLQHCWGSQRSHEIFSLVDESAQKPGAACFLT